MDVEADFGEGDGGGAGGKCFFALRGWSWWGGVGGAAREEGEAAGCVV